jgi:uncharacterized membrane protein YfcA
VHKDVLPILFLEFLGLIVLVLLMSLASVGGVGGGSVIIPVLVGFYSFASKEAIAMSTVLIAVSAVVRFVFFSAWSKHPENPNRTEIDFNTVKMVFPLFLIGGYCGVICYMMLSEFQIAIFLSMVLGYTAIHMVTTSIKKYREENRVKAKSLDTDY